jgi:signal transduction histidine kinase
MTSMLESDSEFVILVAGPLASLDRQQSLLTRVLLVATPLVGLAAAILSWLAASSVLGPVTTMAAEAEAITARSPDWRLRASTAHDEVGQLARAFNRLLDRLGDALRLQRQFMADASHELRTPVSVIQTAAEVTLDRPSREEAAYRDAMSVVCEQSARLGRMVEDMLVLRTSWRRGCRPDRCLRTMKSSKRCARSRWWPRLATSGLSPIQNDVSLMRRQSAPPAGDEPR